MNAPGPIPRADGGADGEADGPGERAEALFRAKRYAEALPLAEAAVAARPEGALHADRLGYVLVGLRRWPEAAEAWRMGIERHGAARHRVRQLVRCHMEREAYAEAREAADAGKDSGTPDATTEAYLVIAALGAGEPGEAVRHLARAAAAAGEGNVAPPLPNGPLLRLARSARWRDVLRFVDGALPDAADPEGLLRAGIVAAGCGADWPWMLNRARDLPEGVLGPARPALLEVDALRGLGRLAEAREGLAALVARIPPEARDARLGEEMEAAGEAIERDGSWRPHLDAGKPGANGAPGDFASANLRVCARLAIRAFAAAAEEAGLAIRAHGPHPWFASLRALALAGLGDPQGAVAGFAEAARISGGDPYHLLHLGRAQAAAGMEDAARETLRDLVSRRPDLHAVERLRRDLDGGEGPGPEGFAAAEPAPGGPGTGNLGSGSVDWLHGGDAGDLIYALAAMRAGGGGRLLLAVHPGTRAPMDPERIAFLRPLLSSQPYVRAVEPWQGERADHDFLLVRHGFEKAVDLATQQWRAALPSVPPDVTQAWLALPRAPRHGRPVFARSARYRNPRWEELWAAMKVAAPDAIFVGTPAEFEEFGHGEHRLARDALELAGIIAGASVFVGNQSLPYALAEGLKVGRALEVSPRVPNCGFPGALRLSLGA